MLKKILSIFAVGLLLGACSESIMDDINKNVNDPADVPTRYILTDAITASAFRVTGSDLAFYASCYIEHNVGTYGQMYNAEIRTGEPIASSTYDNSWTAIYQIMYNLKIVINKCSTGGNEVGNYQSLGIAQVLMAYNAAILTDVFGDVPFKEALQPGIVYQPKVDSQQSIYVEVMALLDNAIENLKKTTAVYPNIGGQDFLYNGDNEKWIKAANALKARYLLRLSLKDPQYAKVLTAVDNAFDGADGEMKYKYDGKTAINPFNAFLNDRDYLYASQSLHNKLVARNDPRATAFFQEYGSGFAPNGDPVQSQGEYFISAFCTDSKQPTYLISYHELLFIKAEALLRSGNKPAAEAVLIKAIETSFVKIGLTVADADTYYNDNVKALFNANPTKEIATQKYFALYEGEALEAYNDFRRVAALDGSAPYTLENPANARGLFPQRYSYGSSDVTTNPNILSRYGDGRYVYTEKVWWAGGSR